MTDTRVYRSAFCFLYITAIVFACSCKRQKTLFEVVRSDFSGIHFNNSIIESDSLNQLDIENIYNGGGVGISDLNNDGMPDIFFTGNMTECRLYLNKGGFRFRDITAGSGIKTGGKWCRGVAITDINCDGWLDIYISVTLKKKPSERKNLLFINLGSDSNGTPHFKEMAAEYGLDDESHTTQADFFDYDNDGDLDVYLVANEINSSISPYLFRPVMKHGINPSTGKLFRNDYNSFLQHPVFTDVSREAGIQVEGYSHSSCITDINNDGWKDIYVSCDFITNDLLWINNHNGTFTDQIKTYFKHTSANSMGCDAGDINNDGLEDYITLDMDPGDNYRKKMMLSPISYQLFQNYDRFGYSYQYVRNTLQLNQGPGLRQDDSTGQPAFSEIGYYAGIEATDWSWTPMITDFNNDGFRDIIINNGFPRDITDHDFATFRDKAYLVASKKQLLMQVPEVKLHNYAFRNNGDLTFTNISDSWGMTERTFSNGSAYADLDGDGDLDLVINNINDEALVYRNTTRESGTDETHFLRLRLNGPEKNRQGIGAKVEIRYDNGKKQVWENNPYRGYLSTIEDVAHFGLGKTISVDTVIIIWQGGRMQILKDIPADREIQVSFADADSTFSYAVPVKAENALFSEITGSAGINYVHHETDFIDFNIQKLLPHKYSEYGPGLASGDINGDGLDDIICGGSSGYSAAIFLQQKNSLFVQSDLIERNKLSAKNRDDEGILLFDADGDGDEDLYISSGGYENQSGSQTYQDHFYVNDGHGHFSEYPDALPVNHTSKFCVRAADFDKDGDPDLFIAGRVDPWSYPGPVSCILLRNDSHPGNIRFTDITSEKAPDLINTGMVCDALFTDYDNDGWADLILAGEWMPVTILKNKEGTFTNVCGQTGLDDYKGWWNSIAGGDFDNDGDIDYIIGNLGLNSFYRADIDHPVSVYAADFDNNGSMDAFTSLYLPASQNDTVKYPFPANGRDDAVKQMISMRSRFQNYKSFAAATIDQLFSKEQLRKALIMKAGYFRSCLFRNDGNNRFTLIPLPAQAQFSMLNGMVTDDFDDDGNLDVLITGNDYGTEVTVGRYDALNGLVLLGNGNGTFRPLTIAGSGVYLPGNGKGLVRLRSAQGRYLVAAGENRGPLRLLALKGRKRFEEIRPEDVCAIIEYADGSKRKEEFYQGCSFLSQSAPLLVTGDNVSSVEITNQKGEKRKITFRE